METQVRKIGGSLYFHIPNTSVKAHGIEEKDIWEVDVKKIIKRAKK